MQSTWKQSSLLTVFGALSLAACGDDEPKGATPWADQRTQIISATREVEEVEPASGDQCIDYQGECLKPQSKCGKNGADIVLDADGRLLDYVCYPGEANLTVEQVAAQEGDIAQRQNNTVIVLDNLDDGVDLTGRLTVDANNVVIYGEDPDNAVISGDVTFDGNNMLLRGVRVRGNLTIRSNNSTAAHCVVEGNVVVQGNNAQLFGCDVLGSVTVTGMNAKVYGNRIGGGLTGSGDCRDNVSVADRNGDARIETSEIGAQVSCSR